MSLHTESPRVGSRAFLALQALHANGGAASFMEWMSAAAWAGSINQFNKEVVSALINGQKVFLRGALYVIADAGLERIGIAIDAPPVVPAVPAGPRYVAPQRDLSARFKPRNWSPREGALDYRDIPSRMGDRLIPHGSKA